MSKSSKRKRTNRKNKVMQSTYINVNIVTIILTEYFDNVVYI